MSARLLLELALRVLGFWYLLYSVDNLMATISLHMAFQGKPPGANIPVSYHLLMLAVHAAIGPLLIGFAPRIAASFYASQLELDSSVIHIGPRDVYRIACFVLGVYLLVDIAAPLSRILLTALQNPHFVWANGQLVIDSLVVAVKVAAGLFLAFGSMPISKFFSNTADPVSIPPHRLTMMMMITMLAIFAGMLTLLRVVVR